MGGRYIQSGGWLMEAGFEGLIGTTSLNAGDSKQSRMARPVAYPRVVPLKIRDVIKLLERHDWRHVRTAGDHRIYRSPDGTYNSGLGQARRRCAPGTWRAIL